METTLYGILNPQLVILIPILNVVGVFLKKSMTKPRTKYIPMILGAISIFLCGLYLFSTWKITSFHDILACTFSSIVQGICAAGISVYAHQVSKQFVCHDNNPSKKDCDTKKKK